MCLKNILGTLNNYGSLIQSAILILGFVVAIYQLNVLKKNVHGSVINQIVDSNRELLAMRITNRDITKKEDDKLIYYALLLNHTVNVYFQKKLTIIEEEWWKALVYDMKQTFNQSDFKDLWEKENFRKCYSESFINFMNTEILDQKSSK